MVYLQIVAGGSGKAANVSNNWLWLADRSSRWDCFRGKYHPTTSLKGSMLQEITQGLKLGWI